LRIIPKVKSLQETKQLRKVTQTTKIQFIQFQAVTLNKIADNLILRTIHERMKDFGYSEKIIQGTIISGINIISNRKFRIFFKSEYFTETGFDVALVRERNGTKTHDITPIQNRPNASLKLPDGKFFKKVTVSGIIPSHIIENTLDDLAEPFLDEYRRQKRDWLQQSFGGLAEIAI